MHLRAADCVGDRSFKFDLLLSAMEVDDAVDIAILFKSDVESTETM